MSNLESMARFGEPQDMEWRPGMLIELSIKRHCHDLLEIFVIFRGTEPPGNEAMKHALARASELSLPVGPEGHSDGMALLNQTLLRGSQSREDSIALYEGGVLQEYCRPPWRLGEQLR